MTAITSEGNISVSSNNITILPENIQTNGVVVKDGLPCDKQGNLFSRFVSLNIKEFEIPHSD